MPTTRPRVRLGSAACASHMFVAVHSEGEGEVRQVLQQAGAQVMLEVPDGRMGHREAWWPLDKFNFNADDWADQRRGPASAKKEAVWLVRLGGGARGGVWDGEATERQARRPALQQLEDLGTYYVAGGLAGTMLHWGLEAKGHQRTGKPPKWRGGGRNPALGQQKTQKPPGKRDEKRSPIGPPWPGRGAT